ncbi:NfeD family protein [Novosphingobium sp. FSY-8]|uniref:NfeD family protein n=1 Tax=Novosphingobium ovatum TaxID=1908523 RepID=A0ABW9XDF8_9SPHN|nr:NfeD family protein [Novosphingobium ovatum]NBC36584.1 NfeD family protein [Novosphingobium ovatum]
MPAGWDLHWAWAGLAMLLAVAEMVVPGVFLIWMAGAAGVVSLVVWGMPMLPIAAQVGLFAALSLGSVLVGRRYTLTHRADSEDPALNDRAARLVGEVVVVTEAITAGHGRVRLGDGEWLARGADAAQGTRLQVIGIHGTALMVAPLD